LDYKKVINMKLNNNDIENCNEQALLSQIHTTIFGARELLYTFITLKQNKYQLEGNKLQAFCIDKIASFTRIMQNKNINQSIIDDARYMVCSMLDEGIVTSYFQNETDIGIYKSLVSQHYNDELGGEKFFTILEKLNPTHNEHLPLLLLGRYILSLGFQGKYLFSDNAHRDIAGIKNKIFFSTNKIVRQLIENYNNPTIPAEQKAHVNFIKNYLYSGLLVASIIFGLSLYYLFLSSNWLDQALF
jgi:type IV/VI secretion system ImpK/VasF family protein